MRQAGPKGQGKMGLHACKLQLSGMLAQMCLREDITRVILRGKREKGGEGGNRATLC